MTNINIELRCTCDNVNEPVNHHYDCDLWFDENFEWGIAWWDSTEEQLVFIGDALAPDDDEDDDDEAVEVYTYEDDTLCAAYHWATGEWPTRDEWWSTVEVHHLADVLMAADLLMEDVSKLPDSALDQLAYLSWAVHDLGADDKLACHLDPIFECCCSTAQARKVCLECGVQPFGTNEWAPTWERVVREVGLLLQESTYKCTCATPKPKAYFCVDCQVQRSVPTGPWTFYLPYSAKKITTSVTPAKSQQNAWDYDEWGGYGSYGTGGGAASYQKCRHYGQTVTLPDGTTLWCSSHFNRKDGEAKPDIGCYMASTWHPEWAAWFLNWNDFGLPAIPMADVKMIGEDVLARARAGQIVELGCIGGHGRTGSMLAVVTMLADPTMTGDSVVGWVHDNYCKEAIEGDTQEWYLAAFWCWLNGIELPAMPEPKPTACTEYVHKTLWKANKRCDKEVCKTFWITDVAKFEKEAAKDDKPKGLVGKVKAAVAAKSNVIPLNGTARVPFTTSIHGVLDDPIDSTTPIPAKPANDLYCAMRRHQILAFFGETCDCQWFQQDVDKLFSSK